MENDEVFFFFYGVCWGVVHQYRELATEAGVVCMVVISLNIPGDGFNQKFKWDEECVT